MGLYSGCSPTLWGKSPAYARAKGVTIHDIRQNCRKVPHRKRIFPAVKVTRKGTRKKGASIIVWVLPGVRCHCTRGKCVKLWAKKEHPPSLWMLGNCCGDRRGERAPVALCREPTEAAAETGFPTLAGFVVKGDALHSAASPCKKKWAVVQCPRPHMGCPCVCLLAGARAFLMPR